MIELPLIFMAGLLGSSHCLGMCGGFALAVSSNDRGWSHNVLRQMLYTAGRISTYASLGAMAGYGGWRLERLVPAMVPVPAILSVVAGLLLVAQGLEAAGVWKKKGVAGHASCLAGSFFASFLYGPTWSRVFLAGVFTGLLPCGLLYGMLALAASTHELVAAMLVMIVFGLGTSPAMIVAGIGARMVSGSFRRYAFTLAAWCLVATGTVSIVRGAGFLAHSFTRETAATPAQACPFCSGSDKLPGDHP